MVSTSSVIDRFEEILNENSSRPEEHKQQNVLLDIEALCAQNPRAYDSETVDKYLKERSEMLKSFVDEYFTASISRIFPLIHPELFRLKRHLTMQAEGKKLRVCRDDTENMPAKGEQFSIKVPLFAYTELFDGKHQASLGRYTRENNGRKYDITIEAKLPGSIGPNVREAHRNALKQYFNIISEMCAHPISGEIIHSERNYIYPEIGAIWIPTLSSLNLNIEERLQEKKGALDPAMILKTRGKSFLVHTWIVDDEEPFERYLKSYSTRDYRQN
jgi:hypothetical protein